MPNTATQVYIYIIHIDNKLVKYLTKIFEKQETIKTGIKVNHSAYTEVLCLLLREPLLKKG
ncbi:hypothetical protein, partial [Ruminococcus flavefaciens]|uniref:hypothetical protein n=1 Tax=Ruminococcus flavefaciens TaxID=1265 RepID=UPI0026F12064